MKICIPYMLVYLLGKKEKTGESVRPFDGKALPKYDDSADVEGEATTTSVRDGIRKSRIDDIKHQVMGVFGPNRTIPVFNLSQLKWDMNLPNKPATTIQIPPSCATPRNTDEKSWFKPDSYNVFFDLQNLSKQVDTTNKILSAKLVLQKVEDSDIHLAAGTDEQNEKDKTKIALFYYNRPLKKLKARKKPVTSVWYSSKDQKVVFDVTSVLRHWLSGNPRSSNHGIVLEAVSESGKTVPVSSFAPRPCSEEDLNERNHVYLNVTFEENSEHGFELEALRVPFLKSGELPLDGERIAMQLREMKHKLYTTPRPSRTVDPEFITLSVLQEIDYLGQKTDPIGDELNHVQNDEPAKLSFVDILSSIIRTG